MQGRMIRNKYQIGIFIVIFIVIFSCISSKYNEKVDLVIEYYTEQNGSIQLFYNNKQAGYPFDEVNSYTEPITSTIDSIDLNKIQFSVPYEQINKIRIDWNVGLSKVGINKIIIKKSGISLKVLDESEIQKYIVEIHDIENNDLNSINEMQVKGVDPYIICENIDIANIGLLINLMLCVVVIIISFVLVIIINYSIEEKSIELIRKNRKSIIIIGLFLLFLIVPHIAVNFFQLNQLASNENRVMAEKPKLVLNNLNEFPKQYEDYYTDHIPLKNIFTQLNSYIKYKMLGISPAKYVIKGQDDWLFYNSKYKGDVDTLADYRGSNLYTQEEMELIRDRLIEKKEYLENKGIEFYLFIAPNKSQIYSEYMPLEHTKLSDKSRTDYLVKFLQETTNIKIIYPKEELIQMKGKKDVYYKLDTHWNDVGAYVGFQALMKEVNGIRIKDIKDLSITQEKIVTGDLANMINISGWVEDTKYTIEPYRAEIETELIWQEQQSILKYSSSNKNGERLLMFRDSFSSTMIPFLTKEFENSTFVWKHEFDKAFIEQEQPNIVIMELVERYVDILKN